MLLFRPWKPDYSGIEEGVPDFVESYFPQILHRPGKILTDAVGDAVYGFVSGSSAQSYQQYGGPGTFSNYKASGPTTDAARSVFRTGGRRSGSKPRKRCPTGFRWNGRRCVKR